jgi:hypothetical protein
LPTTLRPADPLLAPPPLPACPEVPPDADDRWRIALDFGLPVGLRVQRRLGESNWWAEAGAGAWLIAPFVSTCLRYDLTLLKRERNLFALRPGVSATGILFGPSLGVGVDCEFLWQHTFAERFGFELGVRAGVTAVLPSRADPWTNRTFAAPVLCLMCAWQF